MSAERQELLAEMERHRRLFGFRGLLNLAQSKSMQDGEAMGRAPRTIALRPHEPELGTDLDVALL